MASKRCMYTHAPVSSSSPSTQMGRRRDRAVAQARLVVPACKPLVRCLGQHSQSAQLRPDLSRSTACLAPSHSSTLALYSTRSFLAVNAGVWTV